MEYSAETFRQHALEVLDFWRIHAVDREFGGFIPQLERDGRIYDDSQKHLVGAARLVYTFSQGVLLDGPHWCADLARHGAAFLLEHFWDRVHGGWYWCVNRDGTIADDAKRTYGHNFAMLALTEFHRATGDREALEMAERTFEVLEEHVWAPDLRGYREGYDRTWSEVKPTWLGQNCHMHNLEALLALHEITAKERYRRKMADLCRLADDHLIDREHGCIPEEFHTDWTIDQTRREDRISVGHQFEWAWLLMRAEAVVPEAVNARRIDQLMDFAVRHGWDDEFGGVFAQVSSTGELISDRKGFWENGEAAMALLWYGRRCHGRLARPCVSGRPSTLADKPPTRQSRYGDGAPPVAHKTRREWNYMDLFRRTAAFCLTHLADREFGGWFANVARDGSITDTKKGGPWKADYHVIQMCAEVYRFLTHQDGE